MDARSRLFEALGQWSVEICRPDAELAPPQYLLDAIDAATPAPPREPPMEATQDKRGSYWLTPEGRAELRETFDDPNDGNAVRPLLDALEWTEKLAAGEPVALLADRESLATRVDALERALRNVLNTREAEAAAMLSAKNAEENFSASERELDAMTVAMVAASEAEKNARELLADSAEQRRLANRGSEMTEFVRYRFHANEDDYRPVTFPPPGPYWCTGYGEGHSIVVAYLPDGVPVTDYWPEATKIDAHARGEPVFTDRFPKPDWWDSAVSPTGGEG